MTKKIISSCNGCKYKNTSIFSDVPYQALEMAGFAPDIVSYPSNINMFKLPENTDVIFTLRKGSVKLVRSLPDGNTRITSMLKTGDTLGLRAWQLGLNSVDAITLEDVELCRISYQALERIRTYAPELDRSVVSRICSEAEQADKWMTHFSVGSVHQRLANFLLFLAEHQGDSQKSVKLLSRDDMASILAVRPESVSRAVTQFKTDGLIVAHTRGHHTLNLSAIRKQSKQK